MVVVISRVIGCSALVPVNTASEMSLQEEEEINLIRLQEHMIDITIPPPPPPPPKKKKEELSILIL